MENAVLLLVSLALVAFGFHLINHLELLGRKSKGSRWK